MNPPNEAPLVLVAAGTDYHPFDRLVDWVDRWIAAGGRDRARVLVQHGTSRPPKEGDGREYLDHGELQRAMAEAAVVVCHGGPATIIEARRAGHVPVVVPRDPRAGEHVDDHQGRFARRLVREGLIHSAATETDLHSALDRALAVPGDFRLATSSEMARGTAPVSASVRRAGALIDAVLHARADRNVAGGQDQRAAPAGPGGNARQPRYGRSAVSVVIPTRDRPELLRTAISSVLAQDYPGDVRVIVVFDGRPPDRTLVSDDPHRQVSVISNSRSPGLAGARNTGILHADGQLVAFCDDDDTWLPGKLSVQAEALDAHPAAELVCCGITVCYDGRSVDRTVALRQVELRHLLRSRLTELHPSTFLMRREAILDGFGLVEEDIPGSYAEDYELLLRAAQHAPIANVPQPHVRVLWHSRSYFSRNWATTAAALTWLLGRYPEFRAERRGHARVTGQIAFAEAASGNRTRALRWAARTARSHPAEMRAYLAVAVATGLVRPQAVLQALHTRGRGL